MHVATAPDGIRMIDITGETCPMTMVRTRLALDALPDGAALRVRLRGEGTAPERPGSLQDARP